VHQLVNKTLISSR